MRQDVSSYQPSEVSDTEGGDTVVHWTQGDEIGKLQGSILTKVGNTSDITKRMDDADAIKEMVSGFIKGQEIRRKEFLLKMRESLQK